MVNFKLGEEMMEKMEYSTCRERGTKLRDLFSSFVGFLLSMDTFKRLIYDEPLAV